MLPPFRSLLKIFGLSFIHLFEQTEILNSLLRIKLLSLNKRTKMSSEIPFTTFQNIETCSFMLSYVQG